MKIEADADPPVGASTDEAHAGEIELLSFEHDVARAPTRSQQAAIGALASRNSDFDNMWSRDAELDLSNFIARRHQISEDVVSKTTSLASNLDHPPVKIFKVVDIASPLLQLWATKTDQLLKTVTLTLRTLQPKGTKYEVQDLLQVKLNKAYICDISIVGSFPEQPWLSQASTALWQSAPAFDVGPVEQIQVCYRQIEWLVNNKSAFKWDVAAKKIF